MKQETFHTWVGINNLANGEKSTIHKTNSKYCKEKKIKKEEESLKKIQVIRQSISVNIIPEYEKPIIALSPIRKGHE